MPPVVIKVGGSLMDHVPSIVGLLIASHRSVLVVPGGGPFADSVRAFRLDPDTSHWMAVLAMEQYGWYIAAHGLGVREYVGIPERPAVLLPYRAMRDADPLPHSWDVTSDTIAAWVASLVGTDLILLKSVDGITVQGTLRDRVRAPLSCSEVDPMLIPYVLEHGIRTVIINGRRVDRLSALLEGREPTGTVIEA